MDLVAIIAIPAFVAWAISVEYRCASVPVQKSLLAVLFAMLAALIACQLVDSSVAFAGVALVLSFALIIESLLAFSIIPSARGFRLLFEQLPLDLRIVANGRIEVYRSNIARKLEPATLAQIAESIPPGPAGTNHAQLVDSMPETLFKLYRLQAGVAILTENTVEINTLRADLERQSDLLTTQNETLKRGRAMRAMLYRQKREQEIAQRVEADLAEATKQIRTILDEQLSDASELDKEERFAQLALVKVLIAYCKHKGMLVLAGTDSNYMTREELEASARESMADLRSINIQCAVLFETTEPVPIPLVNAIYDCFYSCVQCVLPSADPILLVYVSQPDSLSIEMRVCIECAMGLDEETSTELIPSIATSTEPWTSVLSPIVDSVEQRLASFDVESSVRLEDGLVHVLITSRMSQEGAVEGDAA